MARRPPPMTRWEAGQILIACNDKLCDKIEELKDNGYPELAEKLDPIKRQIGDLFNDLGSHEFGLPGTVLEEVHKEASNTKALAAAILAVAKVQGWETGHSVERLQQMLNEDTIRLSYPRLQIFANCARAAVNAYLAEL